MTDNELYEVQVSKQFLKHINELTKAAIKVYISLAFMKQKRGQYFTASHSEISMNDFNDNDESYYPEWFGIRTDSGQYYKAFMQLEALKLIKVYRRRTKNGGHLPNRYKVF